MLLFDGRRQHDERPRRQQRFNLLEQEESLLATRNQARRGRVQDEGRAFDFRRQRRDTCMARGALGPSERSARRLRPEASHRDPRNDQLVGGPRRRRERSGGAGASSRKATRFSAPKGSPAASARAAAVISESI